jgi:poly(3-hydroxybutyrate) depolymerase
VTDVNPWLRARPLAATRPVTAGEHGGVPVEGWVTGYGDPGERPLVVSVHGGPHYPAGWRFSFEAQRLADRGARRAAVGAPAGLCRRLPHRRRGPDPTPLRPSRRLARARAVDRWPDRYLGPERRP